MRLAHVRGGRIESLCDWLSQLPQSTLVSRAGGFLTQRLSRPFHSIEDSARRVGPSERFGRVYVVRLNEAADFILQFAHADEDFPPERAPLQLSEPGLDGSEPLRAG